MTLTALPQDIAISTHGHKTEENGFMKINQQNMNTRVKQTECKDENELYDRTGKT